MAFFTDTWMNARRNEILRSVCRFQYQINNGSWFDGEINSKEVVDTAVAVFVAVPSSGNDDTVTGVRVYDQNDVLAGSQSVALKRSSLNSALLRFTFPLVEVE